MTDSQQQQQDGGDKGPVPYHRFQQVNTKYRAAVAELEALRQQGQQGGDKQGDGDRAASDVQEDGGPDYKALYETAKQENDRLTRARLQDRAALAHGIPLEMSSRIAGETEQEINADAAQMARYVGQRPIAPNIDGSTPGQSRVSVDLNAALHDQHLYEANRDAIFAALKAGRL